LGTRVRRRSQSWSRSEPAAGAIGGGATDIRDAATFLDAYWERCVKPAGLRSLGSVKSRLSVLKQHLGHLPLGAREEPDEINRFKSDSDYAEDVELASMHRVLERLRAAMNWGMTQTPPLFARSPFNRSVFG
jgi:hypothetical protein